MKPAKLLSAAFCLLACFAPGATTWAAFECQAVCLCTSRCSTQCVESGFGTTCGGFGICVDLCRQAESASSSAEDKLAQLEEDLFGAVPNQCGATD